MSWGTTLWNDRGIPGQHVDDWQNLSWNDSSGTVFSMKMDLNPDDPTVVSVNNNDLNQRPHHRWLVR